METFGHSSWCSSLVKTEPKPVQTTMDGLLQAAAASGNYNATPAPLTQGTSYTVTPPLLVPQKNHIHTTGDWMVYDASGGWAPQSLDIYNNQIGKNIVRVALSSHQGIIEVYDGPLHIDTQQLSAWDQKFAKALIMAVLYSKMNISLTVTQELKLVECLKYVWGYKSWP